MNLKRLIDQIKQDEGFSPKPYWDISRWTWGYGTKAPGPDGVITEAEAEADLRNKVQIAVMEYERLFAAQKAEIDDVRAEALCNMIYNLGGTRFRTFANLIRHAMALDWEKAAKAAADSLWFRQVGKRSARIVDELRTGVKG